MFSSAVFYISSSENKHKLKAKAEAEEEVEVEVEISSSAENHKTISLAGAANVGQMR